MQTLYIQNSLGDEAPSVSVAEKNLLENLDQAETIFTYLLYVSLQVAQFARTDASSRASRRILEEGDLHVNTKIAGNLLLSRLEKDPGFSSQVDQHHLAAMTDRNLVKKLYRELSSAVPYKDYTNQSARTPKEDHQILVYLFTEILVKSEALDQHLEEHFIHWPDNREMMWQFINNFLDRPGAFHFGELISREKIRYARELLAAVLVKQNYCLELIRPKLQNWDADRIAVIDMIIMQMGICEFLYFPTIPAKVTINVYIDLAKIYSTPQSGQFVNGILDSIFKELETGGGINKTSTP